MNDDFNDCIIVFNQQFVPVSNEKTQIKTHCLIPGCFQY